MDQCPQSLTILGEWWEDSRLVLGLRTWLPGASISLGGRILSQLEIDYYTREGDKLKEKQVHNACKRLNLPQWAFTSSSDAADNSYTVGNLFIPGFV